MFARSALTLLALLLPAAPALAQAADYSVQGGTLYASVGGWTVVKSETYGCSAYPEAMPIVFNTPPMGGWQLIFPYTSFPAKEGDFEGSVEVDKASFPDTFYSDGAWVYGSFPLELRKAISEGSLLVADVEPARIDLSLSGSKAALLKVEECWKELTGWTESSSNAGTFAFSGD